MKRDWDVVRSVLEEIEALPEQQFQASQYSAELGMEEAALIRVRHIFLLYDAKFICGVDASSLGGRSLVAPELTWAGHELLDTIRSQTVWERTKKLAKDKGLELTFDAVKALAKVALDQIVAG